MKILIKPTQEIQELAMTSEEFHHWMSFPNAPRIHYSKDIHMHYVESGSVLREWNKVAILKTAIMNFPGSRQPDWRLSQDKDPVTFYRNFYHDLESKDPNSQFITHAKKKDGNTTTVSIFKYSQLLASAAVTQHADSASANALVRFLVDSIELAAQKARNYQL